MSDSTSAVRPSDGDAAPIPDTLGGRYRIERELGSGGMARVYLARDAKHARHVAVKVIRADLAASLGHERFLREIAIAARLRHPNIVPVYDSGDADGVLYFVMPFEEGASLRERLREHGPVAVPEGVSILRDVARALAYAHEHGVVHRDVKPDNVMLSGGAAVVADFGIAKAVSAAKRDASTGTITQTGAGIGTPAYMAPEQAVGDPSTDHRADIYAFGCLAYELFTGKPPFHDLAMHAVIAAHIGTVPVLLSTVNPAVPEPLAHVIARCLEKDPAARPQSARELLAAIEGSATTTNEGVRARPRRVRLVAAVAAGVVLAGVGGYLLSRGRAPMTLAPHDVTVSVLPLESAGDSVQQEIAYGLSDEIATALVKVPGVRVMSSQTIATTRKQRGLDTKATGRELGAQFLVMGSYHEAGGRLNVLAKLVEAGGAVVWADRFERRVDELSTVRDQIASALADSLRKRAGRAADGSRMRGEREVDPEAYRLYLLGQGALNKRALTNPASIDFFRQAAARDTLFAKAFSGLSLALALTPYFQPVSAGAVAADVRAAAQHALRLDPTLAPPHVALGLVYEHAYAWDSASAEFRTAVSLRDSTDIEPLVQYGRLLLFRDSTAQALTMFLSARRTEPASALVSSWVSYAYDLEGQLDSARVESARAFQSDSTSPLTLVLGGLVRLHARDLDGARDFANRLPRFQFTALYTLGAVGDTAAALTRLRALEHERPTGSMTATTRAWTMLGVGDTTAALAALEQATDAGEIWPSLQPVSDPCFDRIRSSRRFQALLRRVNLR